MNNFAISSAGVGEALLRSAAAMKAANNTLDETIGLATAANTILQNPQSVGTMLKTVSMYVRAAKTELEAAGEETEGIAESTGKLRELVKQITKEGGKAVDIMADENTFKSTYQIMKEISDVWDNISDANQAALLEKLGGKRNANAIAAMLENFEIAEQAMQAAADSAGSAMNELEKFQKSIEGHIVAFKTAYQELAQTLIDGDLVKKVIDFGTTMINILTKIVELIDKIGGFGSVAVILGGIGALKSFGSLPSIIDTTTRAFTGLLNVLKVIAPAFTTAMELGRGFTGSLITMVTSAINPVTIGIAGLTSVLVVAIKWYKDYKKEQEEIRSKTIEASKAAKEHSKNVADLIKKYDTLTKEEKDNEKKSDEWLSTRKELLEALGLEEQAVDRVTGEYKELTDAMIKNKAVSDLLKDRRDIQDEFNQAERDLIESAKGTITNPDTANLINITGSGKRGALTDREAEAISNMQRLGLISGIAEFGNRLSRNYELIGSDNLDTAEGVLAAQERLGKVLDYLNTVGLENSSIYSDVYEVYSRMTTAVNNYTTVSKELNDNLLNTEYIQRVIGNELPKTAEEFDALRDSMIQSIAKSGKFVGSIYEIGEVLDDLLREDDRFREFLSAPIESAEDTAAAVSTVSQILAEYAEKLGILRSALSEYERNGMISTETLKRLNEVFGESNKLVEIQNGKLSINTEEVNKQATALRDEYGMRIAVAGATAEQIKRLDEQAAAFHTIAAATEDPLSAMSELSTLLGKMEEGYELSRDEATKLWKTYPQLRDKIYETARGYVVETDAIRDLIRAKSDLMDWNNKEARMEAARAASIQKMGSSTSSDRADQVFAKFREDMGRNIETIEEYKQAWLDMFGFVAKGSVDYAKEMIEILKDETNPITQSFEVAYINNDKEGYDPTKKEKTSTTKKEETEFEKAYKKHQHDLAMDKETTEAYLSWLNWAYQDAYNKNEITLDDWYKYEEEVYEGRKQLFQTSLDEMQHQIDLLEHQTGDTYDKQAGIYMQMQREVHAQAEALRARGIKENDEMIRELQDQWWSYEESIRQLREQSFNDWLNDQKFTIDLQKKNNESTDAILQSWKTVLGSLNDELNYYLSVGYDKTSDVVQNIMGEIDSAKEEMISVLEEVVSKANEVVDGFQNVYTTLTNAASEYASTGYLSVDSLQSILELGPKYLAMLEDENGQLVINEDRLQQVIAARTNEMAAETALSYAKQVLLATESGEIDKLRELADVQSASSNATWDMAYATLGYAKTLGAAKGIEESFYDNAISYVTKMQSVTQTATASISAYYETLNAGYVSQAEGLETILKLTEDMIKQENDDKIDALEKEKDVYKDIIDEKKELLRLAKEQADHDRDQADKLKEIADLQSRIDQLALDDSREATAQRAQLEAELLEKQKALADEHGDYAYDAQVDALDKQYEAFEKEKEDETKALKEELNSAEKLYQAAIARINNGWDTLYQDLLDWNYNYGSTLEKDLTAAWNAAYAAAERYGSFVEAMEGVKEHTQLGEASYTPQSANVQSAVSRGSATITNYTNQMRANSLAWFTAENPSVYAQENQRLAKEYQQQTGTSLTYNNGSWYQSGATTPLYQLSRDEVGHAVVEAMKANSAAWNNSDYNTQMKLAQTNEDLAKRLSSFLGVQITKTPGGVWMLGATPLYDVRKFHSGGIAGGNGTIKQNEIMAILKKGESVLDSKREEALYKTVDFVQILSDKIGRVIDRGGLSSLLGGGAMSLFAPMGRAVASGVGTMNFAPTVNVTISGGNLNEENARRYGNVAADAVLDQLKTAFTKRGISAAGNGILK